MKKVIFLSAVTAFFSASVFANADVDADVLFQKIKDKPTSEIEKAFNDFGSRYKMEGGDKIATCVNAYANVLEGDYKKTSSYLNSQKCVDNGCCSVVTAYMYAEGYGVEKDASKTANYLNEAVKKGVVLDSFTERLYVTTQFSLYKNKDLLNPDIDLKVNIGTKNEFVLTPINRVQLATTALASRVFVAPEYKIDSNERNNREKIGFDEKYDGIVKKYFVNKVGQNITNFGEAGRNSTYDFEGNAFYRKTFSLESTKTESELVKICKTKNKDKIVSDIKAMAEKDGSGFVSAYLGFALMNAGQNDEALKVFTSSECNHNLCKAGLFTYTVNVEKNYDKAFAQLRDMGINGSSAFDGDIDKVVQINRQYEQSSGDESVKIREIKHRDDYLNCDFDRYFSTLVDSKSLLKTSFSPYSDFLSAVYKSMNSADKIKYDGKFVSIEERALLASRSLFINAYVLKNRSAQEKIMVFYPWFTGMKVSAGQYFGGEE